MKIEGDGGHAAAGWMNVRGKKGCSLSVHMHCIFLIREAEMPSNRHKKKQGMITIYVRDRVAHIL